MQRKRKFDRDKMRREFMQSNVTLRELAKRHGCSYRHLSGLSSKERWYPQRRELQQQAEQVANEALLKRVTEKSTELAQIKALTAEQHVERSLQTGEQLHQLLRQGLAALQCGDIRELKSAIDAWASWDRQMRANHRIEAESAVRPIVDINLLSALPDIAELHRRQEAVEVETT